MGLPLGLGLALVLGLVIGLVFRLAGGCWLGFCSGCCDCELGCVGLWSSDWGVFVGGLCLSGSDIVDGVWREGVWLYITKSPRSWRGVYVSSTRFVVVASVGHKGRRWTFL